MSEPSGTAHPFGPFERMLSLRYLRARRQEGFISVNAALSLSRTIYVGGLSQGNASVIWHANHSAVGCRVTANYSSSCRRPWPRTRNAKSCPKAIVGTTKRSIDAIPSAWLRRKVFHVCNGRPRLGPARAHPTARIFVENPLWGAPHIHG
jgi:hypothetical protein